MGIYLPKVYMPQGDETLTIQICPDGSIWQRFRGTVPGAKSVSVPPHGRLIDADALINNLEFTTKHCTIKGHTAQRYREMIVELSVAPTIIPEEK